MDEVQNSPRQVYWEDTRKGSMELCSEWQSVQGPDKSFSMETQEARSEQVRTRRGSWEIRDGSSLSCIEFYASQTSPDAEKYCVAHPNELVILSGQDRIKPT
jgi:hypothetical protein